MEKHEITTTKDSSSHDHDEKRRRDQQQQQQVILLKRKRDHDDDCQDNNNNNNNNTQLPLMTSIIHHDASRPTFTSLMRVLYIRRTIFKQAKMIHHISVCATSNGKDIIELPQLGMITKYAMPWDFIKHYLPPRDQIPLNRRMYVISKYCLHQNATVDTLLHLLEWSPDYDPQDDDRHDDFIYHVITQGTPEICAFLLTRFPNINVSNQPEYLKEYIFRTAHLSTIQLLSTKGAKFSKLAMNTAAERGSLDIVMYLDQNRTEGCTTKAMNGAASYGHFDIIKYLHSYRTEGCTTNAMDGAASKGHLDIIKVS
ncbi:hypothetical protein DFA_10361 [Cavenderia fasciculata]|uniref:Ankyrin repeat-containing protein n=1 Tax=Cavenderia fasciculata TaxID=261658 RepID=F4QA00_CACFS|nr:uncharacterized protein DFA_10361 [Cavenderia fasciculata]EGG15519.1 hypothetical protein DFA_10361 [Cavenderia fasciculata]|eukprot:XP_004354261.1 hypothetical protein DFA_10361 [Cavenderia fasciculata]